MNRQRERLGQPSAARQLDHERRVQALGLFLAAYEAEHGIITEEEMAEAACSTRAGAIVVRDKRSQDAV